MQNIKNMVEKHNSNLSSEFYNSMKNEYFEMLVNKLNLDHKLLFKYTSRLNDCASEIGNCSKCKMLFNCQNELKGYFINPVPTGNSVNFSYNVCRYKELELKNNKYKTNIDLFDVPELLKNAKIKDIYLDDKSRIDVIRYIDSYYKNYDKDRLKGIYLYGNFGSGKTYIISALFNELAKKNTKSAIIYFPEFLRTLKSSFVKKDEDTDATYTEKYEYIKKVELLLIDDIGAENITPWARDEVLGTLLQYRMEENKPTFFTSNLSLEELEIHLSLTGNKVEKVKARRIIERIKYLTNDMKVIGVNRRA